MDNSKRRHGVPEEPDWTCEQPLDSHQGKRDSRPGAVPETGSTGRYSKKEDHVETIGPGEVEPANTTNTAKNNMLLAASVPVADAGSTKSGWSDNSKSVNVEKKDLRSIQPLHTSSPGAVSMGNQDNHSMLGNTSQWDNLDVDGGAAASPDSFMPNGLVVAAEVVPETSNDEKEVNARMASDIAELQQKLRVQENQDVIQAVPMSGKNDGEVDHNAACWRQRRMWLLFGILLVGGIIAVVVGVTASSPSESGSRTPAPTMRPTHPPSPMPTAQPSALPTITPQPTMFPSQSPTLSPRTSLLQTLLPTLDLDSGFNTTEAWDAYLTAYPNTPQAKAIAWLTEDDEYFALLGTLDAQELQERYALVVLYFATSGPRWDTSGPYYLRGTISVCDWNLGGTSDSDDDWFLDDDDDSLTFDFFDEGVYCDDSGSVNALVFWLVFPDGTIPSEIALLANLESLDLTWNLLSGTYPRSLGIFQSSGDSC
eukprot:Nitzschia sp. Nitz4//scaffold187_size43274//39749//41274//NITZ4_007340-RA/size43274-augustus-gene-0.5-mRNA-1//1//CDS//3329539828//8289//frame0